MKPKVPDGAVLHVSHLRAFEGVEGLWTKTEAKKLGINEPVSGRGGVTRVVLEIEGRSPFCAFARCNPSDNFNKARGRMIATGRAVKMYEEVA